MYFPDAVTLFCIHAQHRMTEAERRDENGALLKASQFGSRRSDVTSALRGSPNQPIRSIVHYSWIYVRTPRTAILRSVGEVHLA